MFGSVSLIAGATAFQQSLTFRPFEFYFVAAVAYYVIALMLGAFRLSDIRAATRR